MLGLNAVAIIMDLFCSLGKQQKNMWFTGSVDLVDMNREDEVLGRLWNIHYERHRTMPASKVWQERKHSTNLLMSNPSTEMVWWFSDCATQTRNTRINAVATVPVDRRVVRLE